MVDTVSKELRSSIMGRVRNKDTAPEMHVRRLVFSLGYRYRLHVNNLPGRPDLVFPGRRKVIFVHGCFWHRHAKCAFARIPKSRTDFWIQKLEANRRRDVKNVDALEKLRWRVLIVWECEISDEIKLKKMISGFLGPRTK